MTTLLDQGSRTARKEHRCSCCGKAIPKGTTYFFAVVKFDDVYTWRSHNDSGHCGESVYEDYEGGTHCDICGES